MIFERYTAHMERNKLFQLHIYHILRTNELLAG